MLKKTVVILFVTTLFAFSLVTANIIAASNMSTAEKEARLVYWQMDILI